MKQKVCQLFDMQIQRRMLKALPLYPRTYSDIADGWKQWQLEAKNILMTLFAIFRLIAVLISIGTWFHNLAASLEKLSIAAFE